MLLQALRSQFSATSVTIQLAVFALALVSPVSRSRCVNTVSSACRGSIICAGYVSYLRTYMMWWREKYVSRKHFVSPAVTSCPWHGLCYWQYNTVRHVWPCHGSGGYLPASNRGGSGSVLGQSMWDLWWTKWHWDRFLPENFGFPLSIFIPPMLHYSEKTKKHESSSSQGCTISLKAAVRP
jgi:hypothetical protein